MEKVRLPKEVADAIEYYRSCDFSNRSIICEAESVDAAPSGQSINEWLMGSDERYDWLYAALVNGYEVEQTPEDKVKNLFDTYLTFACDACKRDDHAAEEKWLTAKDAVRETVILLNYKIEGVNA